MRSRYPLLWLKKRGQRRSGSPGWGYSGELLYHGVFVVVGVVAAWWHLSSVLLPELRQRERLALLDSAECVIESAEAVPGVASKGPRWRVRLLPPLPAAIARLDAKPAASDASGRLFDAVAPASASRNSAAELLDRFPMGKQTRCWIDPDRPEPVILARGFRWWPWWMLLIPLSLAALGLVGLTRTLFGSRVSAERRQLVAQHASRFDPLSGGRVSVALATGLPSTHDVGDSPGVKLRYRLPMEGAGGWRLAGMTVMCVAWNVLVGLFVVGLVADTIAGRAEWAIALLVAPLACGGGWLAYALIRDAVGTTGIGVTQIEIATHPVIPGQTDGGVVLQAGHFRARWLAVSLVCEEIATYCQGTDTRTATTEVYRQQLLRSQRFRVEGDRPLEQAFTFTVPEGAMHSFLSPHNEIRWLLEVHGKPVRWPEFRRRFRLCVYPSQQAAETPGHHAAEGAVA